MAKPVSAKIGTLLTARNKKKNTTSEGTDFQVDQLPMPVEKKKKNKKKKKKRKKKENYCPKEGGVTLTSRISPQSFTKVRRNPAIPRIPSLGREKKGETRSKS